MDMDSESLESFYFKEVVAGKEHDYRITMNDCKYSIEQDGKLVAEIHCNEIWEQISGDTIPPDVVEFIGEKIEAYFGWPNKSNSVTNRGRWIFKPSFSFNSLAR